MKTPSSILNWRMPQTEEPVCYSLWGPKESDTTELLSRHRGPATNLPQILSDHTVLAPIESG